MKPSKLSLILPCYNEAEHFGKSVERIISVLEKSKTSYEIIFVEDKSTDTTKKLIQRFMAQNKKLPLKAVFHKINKGRGVSVIDGIKRSQGEVVGFIDIDLEISPSYIPAFVRKIQRGSDVCCASRVYTFSQSGFIRWVASKTYRILVQLALGISLKDTEAGYKFFKRKSILPIIAKTKSNHWFWDTEVMALSFYRGLKISEIPTTFTRRFDKTSTVRLLPDTISYIKNIVQFRDQLKKEQSQVREVVLTKTSPRLLMLPIKKINRLLPNQGVIYDIGCGAGATTYFLGQENPKRTIIGIDASERKIRLAQKGKVLANIFFIKADALTVAYRNCTGAVLSDFLHHMPYESQEKLLKKIIRKVQKNGIIIIKEIDRNDSIRCFLSRVWDFLLYPNDVIYYRSKNEWREFLESMGFSVKTSQEVLWFPGSTTLFICTKL